MYFMSVSIINNIITVNFTILIPIMDRRKKNVPELHYREFLRDLGVLKADSVLLKSDSISVIFYNNKKSD